MKSKLQLRINIKTTHKQNNQSMFLTRSDGVFVVRINGWLGKPILFDANRVTTICGYLNCQIMMLLCYVMLCYVVLCYVVLCHVMLCCII